MKLFRRTFLAAGLSATSAVALRSALASPLGMLRSRGKLAVVYSRSPEGTGFSDCVRREFGGELGEITIDAWTADGVARARAFLGNLKDVRLIGFVTDEGAAVINELVRDLGGRELFGGQHVVIERSRSIRHVALTPAHAAGMAGFAPPPRHADGDVPPGQHWYETIGRALTLVAANRLSPPEAASLIGAASSAPFAAGGSFQTFVVQL